METFQLSEPRLKCGEVFIWDCVGELFAIECQLCEERPLCTLSEFTEHMDVWHYDWTAEAYSSLPDMPDTTTMSEDENTKLHWATASELVYPSCSATPTDSRRYSLSGGEDNELESDYFDDEAADKTVEDVEMEIEAALENGSTSSQTTMVYDCNRSSTTASPSFAVPASSAAPFASDLMLEAAPSFPSVSAATTTLCASSALRNADEEIQKNNAQASTTSLIMQKQVENHAVKSLKTQKLIEIYEKFPELWHKQRNPMDTDAQIKAYRKISLELSQQGIKFKASTVQRRIHTLRKRYRLEKLAELKNFLEGYPHESTFEFYDQLQFLKHHIAPQLCKICQRICKDAAECCVRPLVTMAAEEQSICDSEVTESADEDEYTETVQMNDNQGISVLATNGGAVRMLHGPECGPECDGHEIEAPPYINSMDAMPANVAGVTPIHQAVVGNEFDAPTTIVSVPTAVGMVTYSYQPEIACLDNAGMPLPTPFVQHSTPENDSQQKTFIELRAPVYEPEVTNFVPHIVPMCEPQESFIQQCATQMESQQTLLDQQYFPGIQSQEMLLAQQNLPGVSPQEATFMQHTVPETEPRELRRSLRNKNKIEILEVLELPTVQNFKPQEQEVSTSTDGSHLKTNIDENMPVEEYASSNGDSGVLRDLDEQCDKKVQTTMKGTPRKKRHPTFARLSTEQARKLISIYEKYPVLWNPKHADHGIRERRRKAWNQITAQVNEIYKTRYTWTTVHRKMHDYMKYYRRERQRIEAEGGQTRWFFYHNFTFLNEVIDEENSDVPKILQSKMHNQKIIEMYYKYPQLWDTHHADFKRRTIRQGLFKEMSEKLQSMHNINLTGLKLQQRLVEFRCTYRMEKERRCSAEKRGETYTPRYEYYQQLHFLDAHTSPFKCDKCNTEFTKYGDRSRHMQKEHGTKKKVDPPVPPPPRTIFQKKVAALNNVCHICGNGFTLRRTLLSHLKRHNTQPTRVCSMCPKRFFDTHTLQIHERSHTKSRPFICDKCGASYASGSKLNQHLKRHNNQRDHPCVVCSKAFYSAFECERHMRTHVNIREKVCPVCGKDFAVGSSYYAHMLLHEEVKRYNCPDCTMQFAQFAGLYKHRKRHHPKEFASDKAKKNREVAAEKQEMPSDSTERAIDGSEF